jgi:hypothetical protein
VGSSRSGARLIRNGLIEDSPRPSPNDLSVVMVSGLEVGDDIIGTVTLG